MTKKFSDKAKIRARDLYFEGKISVAKIAEILTKEYQPCKTITIYKWIQEEQWDELKKQVRVEGLVKFKEKHMDAVVQAQEEQQEVYRQLREKGREVLLGETPRAIINKAKDAIEAIDVGIRGEREIQKGLIQIEFIEFVAGVLTEEIHDHDLLLRISGKLKAGLAKFFQK